MPAPADSAPALPLAELEANFSKVFPKDLLSVLSERQVLDMQMKPASASSSKKPAGNPAGTLFPANLVVEGHDQHSRWFLSSVILSMALTDQAPFKTMKTHGLLVDNKGEKISKSAPLISKESDSPTEPDEFLFDPTDFIEGSLK